MFMLAHNPLTDRAAIGAEQEPQVEPVRPRKINHIDMDAFYASVSNATIPRYKANRSPSVGPVNGAS
jgi:hypothetical protein